MANNTIRRSWNMYSMVNIEDLRGSAFQDENGGHTFEISGTDGNGNNIALSGSVSAIFLRADNTDVAIVGSVSGGKAYVTLTDECYDMPGWFGLTIYLTSEGQTAAIYAAVGSVHRTSSGTVSPGTQDNVEDLIAAIEAAVASIPADYSALWTSLAPEFSTSASYSAGQYVTYNGSVYRFVNTHSGSWSASDAVAVDLGSEMRNARGVIDSGLTISTTYEAGYIDNNGDLVEDTSAEYDITSDYIYVRPGMKLWFEILYDAAKKPWLRVSEYNYKKEFLRRLSNIYDSTKAIVWDLKSCTLSSDAYFIRVSFASRYTQLPGYKLNITYGMETFYKALHTQMSNIFSAAGWGFEPGNRKRVKIETDGTGVKVYVPDRLFFYGFDSTLLIYAPGQYNTYSVPHNSYLYYDYKLNQLVVAAESTYEAGVDNPHVVLLFCNNGKALGQWSRYQRNETDVFYSVENFHTAEFINRQGMVSVTQGVDTPENSLAGCAEAKKQGFNRIRISVQLTSDNVPVAYHDSTLGGGKVYLNGTLVPSSNTTKISDLTYNQLLAYDFGKYANDIYAGTTIATLDDHVKQAKLMGYKLDIELKENVTAMTHAQFDIMHNIVSKYSMAEKVCWGCYYVASLEYFQTLNENYAMYYCANALSTAEIDVAASVYNGHEVGIFPPGASFLSNYTDAIAIYASNKHVILRCGTQTSTIDMPYYTQRLGQVECAYVAYPVTRLLP